MIKKLKELFERYCYLENDDVYCVEGCSGIIANLCKGSGYVSIWRPEISGSEIFFSTCVLHKRVSWSDYEEIKKELEYSIELVKQLKKEVRRRLLEGTLYGNL